MLTPVRQHHPSHICAPKRLCVKCGYYRSCVGGSRRIGIKTKGGPDRGFVCADCARPAA